MTRLRLATVWLGGCSGCHMSFLDLDEWLFELAKFADVVFSPVADIKTFPENVDVALVEGAVANEDNLELIKQVRERSKLVVSFGDCAITGNVTALRNLLGEPDPMLQRIYLDEVNNSSEGIPREEKIVPKLLSKVLPVHQVIKVDAFLPGCPPSAARIQVALESIAKGETPKLAGEQIRFGQGV
jgi:NAD-reducing hydrogenase small subunit